MWVPRLPFGPVNPGRDPQLKTRPAADSTGTIGVASE